MTADSRAEGEGFVLATESSVVARCTPRDPDVQQHAQRGDEDILLSHYLTYRIKYRGIGTYDTWRLHAFSNFSAPTTQGKTSTDGSPAYDPFDIDSMLSNHNW